MKKVVVNFSHPLDVDSKNILEEMLDGEVFQIVASSQVDLSQDLDNQIGNMWLSVSKAFMLKDGIGCDAVYIIPPALGVSAYMLGRYSNKDFELDGVIIIGRDSSSLTPKFIPLRVEK